MAKSKTKKPSTGPKATEDRKVVCGNTAMFFDGSGTPYMALIKKVWHGEVDKPWVDLVYVAPGGKVIEESNVSHKDRSTMNSRYWI